MGRANSFLWRSSYSVSRQKSIVLFNDILTKTLHRLEFKDFFTIKYKGSVSDSPDDYNKTKLQILKLLEKNISKEIMLKRTLYGPHRDDSVALFASEEQKRSLLALIKMTEHYFLKFNFPEINPIFCLDDLNISLDVERSSNILSEFSRIGQSFITSCNSISDETLPGNIIFIDSRHSVSILKI